MFGFNQYNSIQDVDAEIAKVAWIGGTCNAGAAILECKASLFFGGAGGRNRVLLILMAGKSNDEVLNAAGSLTTAGVKIIVAGMGGLFDQSQLSAMAVSSSYVLNAASFGGLTDIRGSVSSLISQGTLSHNSQ